MGTPLCVMTFWLPWLPVWTLVFLVVILPYDRNIGFLHTFDMVAIFGSLCVVSRHDFYFQLCGCTLWLLVFPGYLCKVV